MAQAARDCSNFEQAPHAMRRHLSRSGGGDRRNMTNGD
jgi:hypothetical protein